MAFSTKDTTGRGTSDFVRSSEDGSPPGPVPGPGNVELAKLGDMVKSLKDEYTRASTMLSEMESVYETCSSRLADCGRLIGRIDGVFDSLSERSSSLKEEQQKAAETRIWSIVAGGVLRLGVCHVVFPGDDDQLAKADDIFTSFGLRLAVSNGDGESTLTPRKRTRETDSDKLGEKRKEEGGPFEVRPGSY